MSPAMAAARAPLEQGQATKIHLTAVIEPGADIAEGVQIGPYSVVGADVRIGRDTVVGPHVVIEGHTTIGERNRIYQFASIGATPQDESYHGQASALEIGDENVIR